MHAEWFSRLLSTQDMPSARAAQACQLEDGRVLVLGGWTDEIVEFFPVDGDRDDSKGGKHGDQSSMIQAMMWPCRWARAEQIQLQRQLEQAKSAQVPDETRIAAVEEQLRVLVGRRRWLSAVGESVSVHFAQPHLLSEIRVRNTHNGEHDDSCTHRIKIEFSNDGHEWRDEFETTLQDRRGGQLKINAIKELLEKERASDDSDADRMETLEAELALAKINLDFEFDIPEEPIGIPGIFAQCVRLTIVSAAPAVPAHGDFKGLQAAQGAGLSDLRFFGLPR